MASEAQANSKHTNDKENGMRERTGVLHAMFRNSEIWETLANLAQWVARNIGEEDTRDNAEVEHEEGLITWDYDSETNEGEIELTSRHFRVAATYSKDKYGRIGYRGTALTDWPDNGNEEYENWQIAKGQDSEVGEDFEGTAGNMAAMVTHMWWAGALVQHDVLGYIR